jgi:hypothetical protein
LKGGSSLNRFVNLKSKIYKIVLRE